LYTFKKDIQVIHVNHHYIIDWICWVPSWFHSEGGTFRGFIWNFVFKLQTIHVKKDYYHMVLTAITFPKRIRKARDYRGFQCLMFYRLPVWDVQLAFYLPSNSICSYTYTRFIRMRVATGVEKFSMQ
jgi:hypothetical protein